MAESIPWAERRETSYSEESPPQTMAMVLLVEFIVFCTHIKKTVQKYIKKRIIFVLL